MIIISEFGKILRKLRISKELTQKQLANELGLTFSTISMYERGERQPNLEIFKDIADFFDVSADYLLVENYRKKS